jgi:hypothetical protein
LKNLPRYDKAGYTHKVDSDKNEILSEEKKKQYQAGKRPAFQNTPNYNYKDRGMGKRERTGISNRTLARRKGGGLGRYTRINLVKQTDERVLESERSIRRTQPRDLEKKL